ncbi:outer membrane beta-barrel protein [Anaeromyxobacter oryzae]|uniref:Outer membrane protein beta-barrel domain-containing protein n=1 Tax=Anaeromyxobacter oryzae TaxID=2918170 RepID=A0ABN6MNT5_9BACT|nr:outer membrane beta-barrel protein [Anaeromyxobacter oryzae]BDG02702.1 hypothetical protein AMOR_16980 [Anaeromyxobacter oryzae]
MRKLAILTVALAALAVPSLSHAQVSLGLRLGFAPVGGDAMKDLKMSDGIKSQIPIQLDAIYNLNKNVGLGGYFSYGLGQTASDACGTGVSCSASVMRLGVQGTYTLDPMGQATPWAGVGIGYEWAKVSGGGETLTLKGFEFLNLQVGADFAVAPQLAVGPYLGMSVGQYSDAEISGTSASIPDKSTHEWFQVGVRGKFDL